ncbi:MAG: hypothetical protein JRH20_33000 [Deltaproteobacteria bacterium]|nr:hypothetical protein [Deltaproteobacteria bacterium]
MNKVFRRYGLWLPTLLLIGACGTGQIDGGESAAIARYTLNTDDLGALRFSDCVQGEDCMAYPNPAGCESLDVAIHANATINGICNKVEGSFAVGSVIEGLPFACAFDKARACVICQDAFGAVIFERCLEGIPSLPQGTPRYR